MLLVGTAQQLSQLTVCSPWKVSPPENAAWCPDLHTAHAQSPWWYEGNGRVQAGYWLWSPLAVLQDYKDMIDYIFTGTIWHVSWCQPIVLCLNYWGISSFLSSDLCRLFQSFNMIQPKECCYCSCYTYVLMYFRSVSLSLQKQMSKLPIVSPIKWAACWV